MSNNFITITKQSKLQHLDLAVRNDKGELVELIRGYVYTSGANRKSFYSTSSIAPNLLEVEYFSRIELNKEKKQITLLSKHTAFLSKNYKFNIKTRPIRLPLEHYIDIKIMDN